MDHGNKNNHKLIEIECFKETCDLGPSNFQNVQKEDWCKKSNVSKPLSRKQSYLHCYIPDGNNPEGCSYPSNYNTTRASPCCLANDRPNDERTRRTTHDDHVHVNMVGDENITCPYRAMAYYALLPESHRDLAVVDMKNLHDDSITLSFITDDGPFKLTSVLEYGPRVVNYDQSRWRSESNDTEISLTSLRRALDEDTYDDIDDLSYRDDSSNQDDLLFDHSSSLDNHSHRQFSPKKTPLYVQSEISHSPKSTTPATIVFKEYFNAIPVISSPEITAKQSSNIQTPYQRKPGQSEREPVVPGCNLLTPKTSLQLCSTTHRQPAIRTFVVDPQESNCGCSLLPADGNTGAKTVFYSTPDRPDINSGCSQLPAAGNAGTKTIFHSTPERPDINSSGSESEDYIDVSGGVDKAPIQKYNQGDNAAGVKVQSLNNKDGIKWTSSPRLPTIEGDTAHFKCENSESGMLGISSDPGNGFCGTDNRGYRDSSVTIDDDVIIGDDDNIKQVALGETACQSVGNNPEASLNAYTDEVLRTKMIYIEVLEKYKQRLFLYQKLVDLFGEDSDVTPSSGSLSQRKFTIGLGNPMKDRSAFSSTTDTYCSKPGDNLIGSSSTPRRILSTKQCSREEIVRALVNRLQSRIGMSNTSTHRIEELIAKIRTSRGVKYLKSPYNFIYNYKLR